MAHYFRHALLAYKEKGSGLRQKIEACRKLSHIEGSLLKLQEKNPGHPKLVALLEKVSSIKAGI